MVHEIEPKIVESTKAVIALFDSLFDLARLDSGQIRLRIESGVVEPLPAEELLLLRLRGAVCPRMLKARRQRLVLQAHVFHPPLGRMLVQAARRFAHATAGVMERCAHRARDLSLVTAAAGDYLRAR